MKMVATTMLIITILMIFVKMINFSSCDIKDNDNFYAGHLSHFNHHRWLFSLTEY